jgi:hypothetical protein
MKMYYSLRIIAPQCSKEEISNILNVKSNYHGNAWIYEVITTEDDEYFDFINTFLDLLEGKYELLSNIGVKRDDIGIWMIYEYDNQCNMEFRPQDLGRLGGNNIGLCISCYTAGEDLDPGAHS